MTEPTADDIREALAQAMADPPEPNPWSDVERRATELDRSPPVRRQTGLRLAAAACVIALVGGIAVVVGSGGDSRVRIEDDPNTTISSTQVSTPASTSAPEPTTTLGNVEAGWTGGLVDDIDEGSLRPLDSFTVGDVIVPTAPTGWRVMNSGSTSPDDAAAPSFVESYVNLIEARPDGVFSQVVYLTSSREWQCNNTLGCAPTGETVTIDGVVWESIGVVRTPEDDPEFVDQTTLRARVGDRWISLAVGFRSGPLLDEPAIIELLEGLRVGSSEELAEIGDACWGCEGGVDADGNPFSPTIGDIDATRLRPLDTLSSGDVVVPTAPADWVLHPRDQDVQPVGVFVVGTGPGSGRTLEVWVGPACNAGQSSCEILDGYPPIGLPISEEIEAGGVSWGYPQGQRGGGLAAVVGDYIIAIEGIWFESRIPLLDEPDVVAFIDGLRVASPADLPDQFDLTD